MFANLSKTLRNRRQKEVEKNGMAADSVMATGDLGGRGEKKSRQMDDLAPPVIDINGAVLLLSCRGRAQEVRNKQSFKSHPFPPERAVCFRCSGGRRGQKADGEPIKPKSTGSG